MGGEIGQVVFQELTVVCIAEIFRLLPNVDSLSFVRACFKSYA